MRSIEWLCYRPPWVTPNHLKPHRFLHFALLMHLRNCWSQRLQIWCACSMCKSQPHGRQTVPDRVVIRSCDPLRFFGASIISLKRLNVVVKFCTQVGYINSSNSMIYHDHQQKGRGYGHVTVLEFCRLSWCSASRGFVSNSWATCSMCCDFFIYYLWYWHERNLFCCYRTSSLSVTIGTDAVWVLSHILLFLQLLDCIVFCTSLLLRGLIQELR